MPNERFLARLKESLGNSKWKPAAVAAAKLDRLSEMPRFPIRAALAFYFCAILSLLTFVFWLGNPLARIHDPRRGSAYTREPLTCLATSSNAAAIWVGTS